MVPLRIIGIASNIAFIAYSLLGLRYGIFSKVYPILLLHSALLPLNLFRLYQIRGLIKAVNAASESKTLQHLVPYMTSERRGKGDVLFKKGDPADRLYYLAKGEVRLPDVGESITDGGTFGEVGLFATASARTSTAVCAGDCQLYTIKRDKALELYYQNPKFGFFLIRLVSDIVQRTAVRA
jgi:CRP-like cAMP-binding protein